MSATPEFPDPRWFEDTENFKTFSLAAGLTLTTTMQTWLVEERASEDPSKLFDEALDEMLAEMRGYSFPTKFVDAFENNTRKHKERLLVAFLDISQELRALKAKKQASDAAAGDESRTGGPANIKTRGSHLKLVPK